mgnify:CR=1 FL=1|jgi:DNA-binding transcriptional MerR regulator
MNDRSPRPSLTLSIAAVERDTGLSKDTLRVWERRYGFPTPERDGSGERAYPLDQVERLRLIKRLLDVGHRPGRVVGLPADDLQQLADTAGSGAAPVSGPAQAADEAVIDDCLALIRQHDLIGLRTQLGRDLGRLGLPRFVQDRVVPLTRAIGDAWLRGHMQIFEEHACTEVLLTVVRGALAALPAPEPLAGPRVLMSTLPGEPHALALHLAEAMLAVDGAACIPLGPQTPVWDLVLAAEAYRCDVLLLAFSGISGPGPVVDGLTELRSKLPRRVEIWVGGNAPVLHRRPVDGVRAFEALHELPAALSDWRSRQP